MVKLDGQELMVTSNDQINCQDQLVKWSRWSRNRNFTVIANVRLLEEIEQGETLLDMILRTV